MSGPLPQLRGADQLTQSAVRDALALVVSDLCAAVADHAEDPSGEFTGELCFPAGRLQSAITAAHVGGVPWRAPWLGPYQWKNWERRSFAELVRHLGSQFGGDLAWQVMLLVGLAFAENEVRAMAPDVFRSELLLWAPEQISALPPSWFLHPAIAAVVRDGFWFPLESRFRVFVRWYEDQDVKRRPWAHPPAGAPPAPPVKREPFLTGPMLPPRSLRAPPSVAAPATTPASPRLKSEEVEVKKEEDDW